MRFARVSSEDDESCKFKQNFFSLRTDAFLEEMRVEEEALELNRRSRAVENRLAQQRYAFLPAATTAAALRMHTHTHGRRRARSCARHKCTHVEEHTLR